MKIWEIIEQKLNKLILKVTMLFKDLVLRLIPYKAKEKAKPKVKLDTKSFIEKTKKSAITNALKVQEKANSIKNQAQVNLNKARTLDVKSIKSRHILSAFAAFIGPSLKKLKVWYLTLEPKTIALSIAGATTISLASLNIYVQSNKLSEASRKAEEAILVEKLEKANSLTRRPSYFKKEEKQFRIEGVYFPVYFGGTHDMKRLELDFTVQASNKYIKAYFNKNHYLVRNTLNSKISPISVDFPLKEEGKIIIKGKIKKELNLLLKDLEIKGEISEIYIQSIFGG